MKQRIVVIGADNFVGRKLCEVLARSDWALPVAADFRFVSRPTCEAVTLNQQASDWDALLASCNAVVSSTTGSPASIVATMQMLTAALKRANRACRLVHISSMTIYGDATGLVSESQLPVGTLSDYAAARLQAEHLAAPHGDVVTLRPGCEYGPHCVHWSERVAEWLGARRLGDLGAAGDGYCNLTYIDDLAIAALNALQTPAAAGRAFNIATANPPTWNEYLTRFAIALGAVPVRRVTGRWLRIETRLLAIPLKVAEIVATRVGLARSPLPSAIPPSLLSVCRQEIALDVSAAEGQLGMRWTALADGLKATAAALRSSKD